MAAVEQGQVLEPLLRPAAAFVALSLLLAWAESGAAVSINPRAIVDAAIASL
jgi:hypothetical protein